eukprot:scaffold32821_cov112-Isochrysis_galbana.AAC.3
MPHSVQVAEHSASPQPLPVTVREGAPGEGMTQAWGQQTVVEWGWTRANRIISGSATEGRETRSGHGCGDLEPHARRC